MQTLLTSEQMRIADKYTINNLPISSIDLMEKAAEAFVRILTNDEQDVQKNIAIFCGRGNNGGDGLAVARLLVKSGFKNITVYIAAFSEQQTTDFSVNLKRLEETKCKIVSIEKASKIENFDTEIIIDAILGSGLNKPLKGEYAILINYLNTLNKKIYAIDVPSGFPSEGKIPNPYNGIKAYKTICFQRPKINFFFPESILATEKYEVVNIGLSEDFIQSVPSPFQLVEETDIRQILKPRKLFSHKGTYGHALIVAGSANTMGAALLSSMACLHTGAGLITACIPESGLVALNILLPEVMALPRDEFKRTENSDMYQSIAFGPGLGKSIESRQLLQDLINFKKPTVIDADGLNMLADQSELIEKISSNSILTPHMKEFDRLFGDHSNWWDRLQTAKIQAERLKIIIILKNQYTFICLPEGKVCINPTGNPAMAQGGMGDILTGIIVAFLAQKYTATEAAILACYLHGKSGDALARNKNVVTASEVANQIPIEIKGLLA